MTHLPWGELGLEAGAETTLSIGALELTLERSPTDLRVRAHRGPSDPRDEDEWERWALGPDARLRVRPAVPDRLVVVSTDDLFHLPPKGEARVYVRFPLFAQVVATSPATGEVVVADEPSVLLSDTWWGTHSDGELAYWLTTTARTEVTDDLFLPHLAVCPLVLANAGKQALHLDRFAVQVPHLSVYGAGIRNWTDEVTVRTEESPDDSEIRFGRKAPREAADAELVARPRSEPPRGFHVRTFRRLRSLSGGGAGG